MNLNELNPFVRYAALHRVHLRQPKEVNVCYDCRIFFAENALGEIIVNGEKYKITNTTAIYLPPATKYIFKFENSDDFKMLVFDFDLISDFSHLSSSLRTATEKNFDKTKLPQYNLPEILSKPIIKNIPQIFGHLKKTTECFLKKGDYFREISSAHLKLSLIEFISQSDINPASELCRNVLDFIRENYQNSSLTNISLSEKFNYHPHYLNTLLKNETGETLHTHLIKARISSAKNLLHTTGYSVEEIAWKVGFESSAYFIKIFKKQVGITPKKYRISKIHSEF